MNDTEFFVYNVTFVYENFHITVTTLAVDEEDAPESAIEQMRYDTGMPYQIFERAQEINVQKVEN